MATLADQHVTQSALLSVETLEANKKAINECLKVHKFEHSNLDSKCLLCITRAVGWVENGNKREDEAHKLLASLPKSVIVNALLAVRTELGQESVRTHHWIWKGEYFS